MGLSRGEALPIFFAAGVLLFLSVALCAFIYELLTRYLLSSKAMNDKLKDAPHSSSWKVCSNCVIELPVVSEQLVSTGINEAADSPQAFKEAPVAITVEGITIDGTENLNSEIISSDGTSQVNLLPKNKINAEVHLETCAK